MVRLEDRCPIVCCSLTLLLIGQLAACTSWRVQANSAERLTVRSPAQLVRIALRNGTVTTLRTARISGDTLYGTPTPGLRPSVAIPLRDVQTIQVRQGDTAKTIGLVAGITVGVAGAIVLWFVETCALCNP